MVTGKNRENFEEWYYVYQNGEGWALFIGLRKFLMLPFLMSIGVYMAYYISMGVKFASLEFHLEAMHEGFSMEVFGKDFKGSYSELFCMLDKRLNDKL